MVRIYVNKYYVFGGYKKTKRSTTVNEFDGKMDSRAKLTSATQHMKLNFMLQYENENECVALEQTMAGH